MITLPEFPPVTVPVALTVAIAPLLELHVPPVTVSDKLIVFPAQTVVGPLIVPASGAGLTVTA